MTHLIWDWNGTLLNDLNLMAESTSVALQALGEPAIDVETYRRHHARPLTGFYNQLTGRELSDEEWSTINTQFHQTYASVLHRAELATDAVTALETARNSGFTQSLLSMWIHDQLVPFVSRLGVADYFERIDGHKAANGETKVESLQNHLVALQDAVARDGNADRRDHDWRHG